MTECIRVTVEPKQSLIPIFCISNRLRFQMFGGGRGPIQMILYLLGRTRYSETGYASLFFFFFANYETFCIVYLSYYFQFIYTLIQYVITNCPFLYQTVGQVYPGNCKRYRKSTDILQEVLNTFDLLKKKQPTINNKIKIIYAF